MFVTHSATKTACIHESNHLAFNLDHEAESESDDLSIGMETGYI